MNEQQQIEKSLEEQAQHLQKVAREEFVDACRDSKFQSDIATTQIFFRPGYLYIVTPNRIVRFGVHTNYVAEIAKLPKNLREIKSPSEMESRLAREVKNGRNIHALAARWSVIYNR
jgi:hypothetical protein